jgi:hypothetical protein
MRTKALVGLVVAAAFCAVPALADVLDRNAVQLSSGSLSAGVT